MSLKEQLPFSLRKKKSDRTEDIWLSYSTSEIDLGILIDQKLNMTQWSDMPAKQARTNLDYMNRSILSKSQEARVPFYPAILKIQF